MSVVRFINRVSAVQLIVESELGPFQGSSEGTRHRGVILVSCLHHGPEHEATERVVWTGEWLTMEGRQDFHGFQHAALEDAADALAAGLRKLLAPWEGED